MKIKCAHCGKETAWENNEFRPFCSERCKTLDFGAWIDEEYVVPEEVEDDELSEREKLIHLQIDDEIADELKKLRNI